MGTPPEAAARARSAAANLKGHLTLGHQTRLSQFMLIDHGWQIMDNEQSLTLGSYSTMPSLQWWLTMHNDVLWFATLIDGWVPSGRLCDSQQMASLNYHRVEGRFQHSYWNGGTPWSKSNILCMVIPTPFVHNMNPIPWSAKYVCIYNIWNIFIDR